jgi:DNA polymerase V
MNPAPIYYSVSAGLPSSVSDGEAFDLANHLIKHPNDTFFVRVNGNSMIDSGIFDGDLLIIDRKAEPKPSDIVVAQVDDGFTVKRFRSEKGRLRLVPANSRYSPIDINEDTRICGVATFAIHRL